MRTEPRDASSDASETWRLSDGITNILKGHNQLQQPHLRTQQSYFFNFFIFFLTFGHNVIFSALYPTCYDAPRPEKVTQHCAAYKTRHAIKI